MRVIVDTGFLSSLLKIERLELITEFFEITHVVIPEQVLEELEQSKI